MQDAAQLLDEEDLVLIHALQLQPRASWSELGLALDVDPVTVARRWARLSGRGEAWVSISPGPRMLERICIAYLEIDCRSGQADAVARVLATHPHMLTIERTAARAQLFATVATADLAALSGYTLDVLPTVPGLSALRARVVTHMFTEGGHWRIAALEPGQRAQLAEEPGGGPGQTGRADRVVREVRQVTVLDRVLLARLAEDGRASYRTLAAGLAGPPTVKRRIDQLTRVGLLSFRCDFARPLGGWPVAVTLWARVPPALLDKIGHAVVRMPEVRNCAAVTGPQNLVLQASLHAVSDVLRLEHRLAAEHPGLDIVEREITLRHEKLLGHLLDPQGRTVGVVAPDVWAEPGAVTT